MTPLQPLAVGGRRTSKLHAETERCDDGALCRRRRHGAVRASTERASTAASATTDFSCGAEDLARARDMYSFQHPSVTAIERIGHRVQITHAETHTSGPAHSLISSTPAKIGAYTSCARPSAEPLVCPGTQRSSMAASGVAPDTAPGKLGTTGKTPRPRSKTGDAESDGGGESTLAAQLSSYCSTCPHVQQIVLDFLALPSDGFDSETEDA
jgi:hypothetical protein